MNYSTAIFLISDQARAVMCRYLANDDAPRTMFKTLDPNIKVDDFVTVPTDTRHEMTVVKVVAVDVDVDFDCSTEVQWIIGVVSRANFEDIERQEDQAIRTIKSAEKKKRKTELAESLLADTDGLKALPIYSSAADAPEAPPPAPDEDGPI